LRITIILQGPQQQRKGQQQQPLPQALELCTCMDIPDLSIYTIQTYLSGTISTFTFPKGSSAIAGQYLYVASERNGFYDFFGFYPTFFSRNAVNFTTGTNVPTLWKEGNVMVYIYGNLRENDGANSGTNSNNNPIPWNYQNGWAARLSGKDASTTFHLADWTIQKGALIGFKSNAAAAHSVPIKTFQCSASKPADASPPVAPVTPAASPPIAPVTPAASSPTARVGTLVKVMSYNIDNSGKKPAWKDVFKQENPDIAVLVEVGSWDDHNNKLLNQYVAEFNTYFSTSRPYHGSVSQDTRVTSTGCALLTRYPIVSTTQLHTVTLDNDIQFAPTHPLMVWSINVTGRIVYVSGFYEKCCGGFDSNRERTMEGFINYLDTLGKVPLFIMGDFNAVSPSDADPANPDYNAAFRPLPNSNLGYGPLAMLLYPNDPTYGKYSSRGVHKFIDTFRTLNRACGVSKGQCCYLKDRTCAAVPTSCIERGYTYHNGNFDSRIDFIIANQFIQVVGPSTVGDTASACAGSDHFALDNHFML
jgi:endonuclease/exonuclease/phosphatase family metal-dependent hydrolase